MFYTYQAILEGQNEDMNALPQLMLPKICGQQVSVHQELIINYSSKL